MTVNPVAFYLLAALIVGCSLLVVAARSLPRAGAGLAAATVLAAVLEGLSGARVLALVHLTLVVLVVGGAVLALRRQGYGGLARLPSTRSGWWPVPAALAAGVALLVIWAAVAHHSDWRRGTGTAALLSVLHQREPIAVGVVVVLLVTAAAGALLIGGVGRDEREFERRRAERRERDERTRRRREDRLAARGRPGPSGDGA